MAATNDTYSFNYNLRAVLTETLDLGLDLGADTTTVHETDSSIAGTLTATTTPAVSQCWSGIFTVPNGGNDTLDLTALSRTTLPDIDMTDLKVCFCKIVNPSTSAADQIITISDGAAPYFLFSNAAGQKVVLKPGEAIAIYGNESKPDVTALASDILFANPGAVDCLLEIMICAG